MQDYREQSESEQGGINPTLSSSDTIDALAVGIRCSTRTFHNLTELMACRAATFHLFQCIPGKMGLSK